MKIIITGTAGFIGFHLTKLLCESENNELLTIDNINDYYDINLKYDRLKQLGIDKNSIENEKLVKSNKYANLTFVKLNIEDKSVKKILQYFSPDVIIHLAAQAGVRYSFENPYTYLSSNIDAFLNILEYCRYGKPKHLIYASSSSVYGINKKIPFSVEDTVDFPISLYAATKKSNELMAHTYSYLFDIPTTGLRFFTVYGPWGRPDMALFKFTQNIIKQKPIEVYNNGNMYRDFTYIDDITTSIQRLIPLAPEKEQNSKTPAPYRLLNIGNGKPINLMDFVRAIEKELNTKAIINYLPLQPGDVIATHADTKELFELINFKPQTSIEQGIKSFIQWYKEYYNVK
jgi:UDP-glucuronate 4-epimerase